jgi:hypothetical protein
MMHALEPLQTWRVFARRAPDDTHVAAFAQRLADGRVKMIIGALGGEVDHVELGININESTILVDDRQCGHALFEELGECIDDGRVACDLNSERARVRARST